MLVSIHVVLILIKVKILDLRINFCNNLNNLNYLKVCNEIEINKKYLIPCKILVFIKIRLKHF